MVKPPEDTASGKQGCCREKSAQGSEVGPASNSAQLQGWDLGKLLNLSSLLCKMGGLFQDYPLQGIVFKIHNTPCRETGMHIAGA